MTEQEALDEIRDLFNQLQALRDRVPHRGTAVVTISTLLDHCKLNSNQPSSLMPPPSSTSLALKRSNASQCVDKSTNTNTTSSINSGIDNQMTVIEPNNSHNRDEHLAKQSNHRNGTITCSTQISITDVCDRGNEIETQYTNQTLPTSQDIKLCELSLLSRNDNTIAQTPNDDNGGELNFSNLHLHCMCSTVDITADDIVNNKQKAISQDQCDCCCHCHENIDDTLVICESSSIDSTDKKKTFKNINSNQTMSNSSSTDSSKLILGKQQNAQQHNCCFTDKIATASAASSSPMAAIDASGDDIITDNDNTPIHLNDACYRQIKQTCYDDETKKNICHCQTKMKIDLNNPLQTAGCKTSIDKLLIGCTSDTQSHASEGTSSDVNIKKCDCINDSDMKTIINDNSIQSTTISTSDAISPSNASKRNKNSDKLVLDLNDRSKYTKEVSV